MRYIFAALFLGMLAFFWFVARPYMQQVTCPGCAGKGFVTMGIVEIPCPYCRSSGKIAPYQRDAVLKDMQKKRQEEEEQRKRDAESANNPSY
jgi:hypothetical protein